MCEYGTACSSIQGLQDIFCSKENPLYIPIAGVIIMDQSSEILMLREELQALKEERTLGHKFRDDVMAVMIAAGHGMWQWYKENNHLLFDNNGSFWIDDLGYSPSEIVYDLDWWINSLHPRSRRDYVKAMGRYIEGKEKFFELEGRIRTKSGDWAWVWTRGISTNFDKNGSPLSMLGIYSNTTEKKEAENQLIKLNSELEQRIEERTQQLTLANRGLKEEIERRKRIEEELEFAKQQAESANQAKTQFLANISHELRTPLHHILNYSKFGIKRFEESKDRLIYYFSQIRISSQRLRNLVDDLLDVAKLELGKVEYRYQGADMYQLVSGVVAEMESVCQNKNITLKYTKPSVPTSLCCDRNRIEQVIYNLISNAIRYSPEGGSITVNFDKGQLGDDKYVVPAIKVFVVDQGVGIPTIELEKIFDAFVQSSFTSTGAGGTGLGLSICKRIIEDHGGKIWAANNPDTGAVFSFLLPYEAGS